MEIWNTKLLCVVTPVLKWRCHHSSCDYDLSNRKVSPKNVFGASTRFEPMATALALQCSTNWAMKTHIFHSYVRSSHNMSHSFHGYDEFHKLACSQRMGLHSSVGEHCTGKLCPNPSRIFDVFFLFWGGRSLHEQCLLSPWQTPHLFSRIFT